MIKRNLLLACSFVAISSIALVGCNKDDKTNTVETTPTPSVSEDVSGGDATTTEGEDVVEDEVTPETTPEVEESDEDVVEDVEYTTEETEEPSGEVSTEGEDVVEDDVEIVVETSSEKINEMVKKIKTEYGGMWLPNMPMDADIFNSLFGVSPELYVEFFGEMPMISGQSDILVVVEPAEGKTQEVLDALNTYKDKQINEVQNYPMNAVQVQATEVYEKDGLVYYIAIFGDMTPHLDADEETLLGACQDSVKEVIAIIDGE